MDSFKVFLFRVRQNKLYKEADIEIHHMTPAVVIRATDETAFLLEAAMTPLLIHIHPKPKVDLEVMGLIVPRVEIPPAPPVPE